MLWFILSFLTALAVASHDAWVKRFFSDLSTYEMPAYPLIYSLPLLILTLPFVPTDSKASLPAFYFLRTCCCMPSPFP